MVGEKIPLSPPSSSDTEACYWKMMCQYRLIRNFLIHFTQMWSIVQYSLPFLLILSEPFFNITTFFWIINRYGLVFNKSTIFKVRLKYHTKVYNSELICTLSHWYIKIWVHCDAWRNKMENIFSRRSVLATLLYFTGIQLCVLYFTLLFQFVLLCTQICMLKTFSPQSLYKVYPMKKD